MNNKTYYITTTLPYVNAAPHIGFALEIVQADVLARYKRQNGYEVVFNFGTDEHGQKIYQKALEAGVEPKQYCDEYAAQFDKLKKTLNLSCTNFIRTTDLHHEAAAQEIWRRCEGAGDIYKKTYKTKYCVGCELYITDSELIEGKCPLHPNTALEIIEEENYFFRFSKYQKPLLDHYKKNPDFVVPHSRFNEIYAFVERGLEDFSISRLKSKMPWGVEVPGDKDHVMYVWFDALTNYISTLGWPEDEPSFNKWWPGIQVAGKDNLRQQCAIWQAMLMSAGLPPSKQIFIHGFITSGGQKMSKSVGNVVDPFTVVEKYGVDAFRYYLLREIPSHDDGDYSEARFKELYNADLANNLGNLVSRVATLAEKYEVVIHNSGACRSAAPNNARRHCALIGAPRFAPPTNSSNTRDISNFIDAYQFDRALEHIWTHVARMNKYLDETAPWKAEKEEAGKIVLNIIEGTTELCGLRNLAQTFSPFLPDTAEKILNIFKGSRIKPYSSLFPRFS